MDETVRRRRAQIATNDTFGRLFLRALAGTLVVLDGSGWFTGETIEADGWVLISLGFLLIFGVVADLLAISLTVLYLAAVAVPAFDAALAGSASTEIRVDLAVVGALVVHLVASGTIDLGRRRSSARRVRNVADTTAHLRSFFTFESVEMLDVDGEAFRASTYAGEWSLDLVRDEAVPADEPVDVVLASADPEALGRELADRGLRGTGAHRGGGWARFSDDRVVIDIRPIASGRR